MLPENYDAWSAWVSLHNHDRQLIGGMSIHPLKLSIITIAQFCQVFGLYEDDFKKIIKIEDLMYNKIVNDYQQSNKKTNNNLLDQRMSGKK